MPGGGKGVIAESFDVHTVGASSRTDINHANSLCGTGCATTPRPDGVLHIVVACVAEHTQMPPRQFLSR